VFAEVSVVVPLTSDAGGCSPARTMRGAIHVRFAPDSVVPGRVRAVDVDQRLRASKEYARLKQSIGAVLVDPQQTEMPMAAAGVEAGNEKAQAARV